MRLSGLDGIRAISVLLVISAHVANGNSYGGFGVEVFFVLSGFLITWLLCCEEDKYRTISIRSFYARRALRILPPAMVYIAVVSFLATRGLASVAPREALYCLLFLRNVMPAQGIHLGHF